MNTEDAATSQAVPAIIETNLISLKSLAYGNSDGPVVRTVLTHCPEPGCMTL